MMCLTVHNSNYTHKEDHPAEPSLGESKFSAILTKKIAGLSHCESFSRAAKPSLGEFKFPTKLASFRARPQLRTPPLFIRARVWSHLSAAVMIYASDVRSFRGASADCICCATPTPSRLSLPKLWTRRFTCNLEVTAAVCSLSIDIYLTRS